MSTPLLILNLTPRNEIWYQYISFCGQPGFQPAIGLTFWRKTERGQFGDQDINPDHSKCNIVCILSTISKIFKENNYMFQACN